MSHGQKMALYAVLALAGAVVPWIFNLQYFAAGGDTAGFVAAVFASPASASIGADIAIACAAFILFMGTEAARIGLRRWWLVIPVIFLVSFACGAPLYLLLREKRLRALESV